MLYPGTKKKIRTALKELHDLSTKEDRWEGFQSAVLEDVENTLWRISSVLDMAIRITDRPGEYNPLKSIEHTIDETSSEVTRVKIDHEKRVKKEIEDRNNMPEYLEKSKTLEGDDLLEERIKLFTGQTSDHEPIKDVTI